MKITIIVIDSLLLFVLLHIENVKFRLFGVDMGIWSIPLFPSFVLLINIFALLFSPKSIVRISAVCFDSFLMLICFCIFLYVTFPAWFPPAIFAMGLGAYLKFIVPVYFLGMNAYALAGCIHDDGNHRKRKAKL